MYEWVLIFMVLGVFYTGVITIVLIGPSGDVVKTWADLQKRGFTMITIFFKCNSQCPRGEIK